MKNYIYHEVPPVMMGTTLYPLNILKEIYPDIYDKEISKYKGREHLINWPVPPLGCTWNDVIFTAMVHPKLVRDASIKAGLRFPPTSYFKIDMDSLDQSMLGIYKAYLWQTPSAKNITSFDYTKIDEYSIFPKEFEEYCELVKIGRVRPFMPYCLVPHIIYKGVIDVTGAEIITV